MNEKLRQKYLKEDIDYFTKELELVDFDISQHNEETLAQYVEHYYEAVDLSDVDDVKKTRYKFLMSIGLLETYLLHNYATFKRTELVYKWAKNLCDRRNNELNEYRTWGWTKGTFDDYLKSK